MKSLIRTTGLLIAIVMSFSVANSSEFCSSVHDGILADCGKANGLKIEDIEDWPNHILFLCSRKAASVMKECEKDQNQ